MNLFTVFVLLISVVGCDATLLTGQKSQFNFERNGIGEIEDSKVITLNQTGTISYDDGTGSCGDSVRLDRGGKFFGTLTLTSHWLMVGSESFSVGIWAQILSTGTRAIVSFGERGVNVLSLSVGFTSGRKIFVFHDTSSISTSTQRYDKDTWVRILIIYDGNIQKLSIYANGAEVITRTMYFLNFDRLNHLVVGSATSTTVTSGYNADYSNGEYAVDSLSIFGGVLNPAGIYLAGCGHSTLTETITLTETSLTASITESLSLTPSLRTETSTLWTPTKTFTSTMTHSIPPTKTHTFSYSLTRQLHVTDTMTLTDSLVPPFSIEFLQPDLAEILAIVTIIVAVASGYSIMFLWLSKLFIGSFACKKVPELPWVYNIVSLEVSTSDYKFYIGSVLFNSALLVIVCIATISFTEILLQLGVDVRVRKLVQMPSDFVVVFFVFTPLIVTPSCYLVTNGPVELKILGSCGMALGLVVPMWIKKEVSKTGLKWCTYTVAIPNRNIALQKIMGPGEWVSESSNHAESIHKCAALVKNSTARGRSVLLFEFYSVLVLSLGMSYRPAELEECSYPRFVSGGLFLLSAAWYGYYKPFCRPIDNVITVCLSVLISLGMLTAGAAFIEGTAIEKEYGIPRIIFLVAAGVLCVKVLAECISMIYLRVSNTFEKSQEYRWTVARESQLVTPPPTSLYTALPDDENDDRNADADGELPEAHDEFVKNTSIFEPISTRSCSTTQLHHPPKADFTNSPMFPERQSSLERTERLGSTILRTPAFAAKNPLCSEHGENAAIKKSPSSMTLSSKSKTTSAGNLLALSSQTLLLTPGRDDLLGASSAVQLQESQHESQHEYFAMDL